MSNSTQKDWEKRFDDYFARIEKTLTGHISGKHIWSLGDDEDDYVFVDESIKQFIRTLLADARKEVYAELEKHMGITNTITCPILGDGTGERKDILFIEADVLATLREERV